MEHSSYDLSQIIPVSEVMKLLRHDSSAFKPNCGLILVDFLVRHEFLSGETDADYNEITMRCHRNLGEHFPLAIRT
jgi:hypothetical protein